MEDLGKVFREFRISKKYSLKEAAGEACSTSQLSRFELGIRIWLLRASLTFWTISM